MLQWIESDQHIKLTTPNETFLLAVELQSESKLIGHVALQMSTVQPQTAAVSVVINERYQKQGYGSEALAGLAGFCLRGIGLHRVTAHARCQNIAGCRMCEKAGRGIGRRGVFVLPDVRKGGAAPRGQGSERPLRGRRMARHRLVCAPGRGMQARDGLNPAPLRGPRRPPQ